MLSTTLLLAASMVVGQAEESKIPQEVLKQLKYMEGTWEVVGNVENEEVRGIWSARWAPGKHCLLRRSEHEIGGESVIGVGVIGWDGVTETITEQVFFSNNGSALLRWKVLPSGNLEGEISSYREGQKSAGKVTMTKDGSAKMLYRAKNSDGEEIKATMSKVERRGKKGKKD